VFGVAAFPTVCVEQVISGVMKVNVPDAKMTEAQFLSFIDQCFDRYDISIDSMVPDDIITDLVSRASCYKDLAANYLEDLRASKLSMPDVKTLFQHRYAKFAQVLRNGLQPDRQLKLVKKSVVMKRINMRPSDALSPTMYDVQYSIDIDLVKVTALTILTIEADQSDTAQSSVDPSYKIRPRPLPFTEIYCDRGRYETLSLHVVASAYKRKSVWVRRMLDQAAPLVQVYIIAHAYMWLFFSKHAFYLWTCSHLR
jgi:hypothetical protein